MSPRKIVHLNFSRCSYRSLLSLITRATLTMSSTVAGGLHKVQEVIQSAAGQDKKLIDLSRDTADVHKRTKFTTDHGVPVSDTDHWLRVVNEKTSGPSLLEDQIAREKVSTASLHGGHD